MSPFDFAFTLFALLLGLGLAQVLGGFVRVLKIRSAHPSGEDVHVRFGWLTPMLALLVSMDLISFWVSAWDSRAEIPVHYGYLLYGAAIAGIYYVAAALVFPDAPERWPDLDGWFLAHKAKIAAGILAANLMGHIGQLVTLDRWTSTPSLLAPQLAYVAGVAALIFVRGKLASGVLLAALIGLFVALLVLPVG